MANRRDSVVWLQINGPRSIMDGSITIRTATNRTWNDLLNTQLALGLADNIRVSTSRFRRENSRRGWSASLGSLMYRFLSHYSWRRTMYKVYLYDSRETGNGQREIQLRGTQRSVAVRGQHNAPVLQNAYVRLVRYAGPINVGIQPPINPHLQVNGIPPDLRTDAQRRVQNFTERFLRRAQREVAALQQNGLWRNNVRRAPMASYLLVQLLREE